MEAIRYPFKRGKQHNANIEDILDGSEYKSKALLESYGNLSFLFNTDGVRVFKSNASQLWPIYLVINELPPDVRFVTLIREKKANEKEERERIRRRKKGINCKTNRFKKENMLLLGLWYNRSKPRFSTFLPPLARKLKKLELEGNKNERLKKKKIEK